MVIPPEIVALVNRLNRELDEITRAATTGLKLVRSNLSRMPENAMLIQTIAYLNEVLRFVNDSRSVIQSDIESISGVGVTNREIQQVGEDLAASLGMTLELKMQVERLLAQLEEFL